MASQAMRGYFGQQPTLPNTFDHTSQRIHSVGYVQLLKTPQRVLLANPMVVPMTGLTILLPRFNSSPLTVSSLRKEMSMRALESEGLNLITSSGMFSLEQGLHILYPKGTQQPIPKNLRHFLGLKANELSPTCLVKMDEAGELEAAAHEVGLTPETSLPHNAELERDIREEKECCRSIHLQSGLPYDLHTHSYPFACLSMSFDRPATFDKAKTQWEALTKFDGIRHCFGQLVYYRKKGINKRTLEPNLAPAFVSGLG